MATFLSLFDTHSSELDAALPPDITPDRAAEAISTFVSRVHDRWTTATQPDEVSAIAARGGVDILQAASALIVSASRTEVWQQAGPGGMPGERKVRPLLWWRIVLALIVIVLTGYIGLVLWTMQRWNELILIGALAAAELGRVIAAWFAGRRRRRVEAQTVADVRTKATVHIDRQALMRRLSHAFAALDKLVDDARGLRPTVASAGPVIEDAGFTELLQDLMEAREVADGEYALRVLRSLQSILERHGIEVISYDGANRQLFEFQPALGPAGTLRPAMVQNGRVLRRGLVAEAPHVR